MNNPGLYTIRWGQTVSDAVNFAGGLTDDAVTSSGILASIPENFEHIYIPFKNVESQKININYAEQWLLEALPGIGTTKAKAIIAYRNNTGYFTSINDIKKVPGIGETIFDQIKDKITI